MPRFVAFTFKEFRQLARDRSALALLFLMPAVFILIMSLALQTGFEDRRDVRLDYFFVDHADTEASRALRALLDEPGTFRRLAADDSVADLRARVRADEAKFLLLVDPRFDERLFDGETAVTLEAAPGTERPTVMLFEAYVRQSLGSLYLDLALKPLFEDNGMDLPVATDPESLGTLLGVTSLYEGERAGEIPTSVQQNVPAWLVFAMFFVAVPLSTTLIGERKNGTLARLDTMSLPRYQLFAGKLIPYFFVNLVQVVLMLLVGVWLVPLFGGDRLVIGGAWGGLAIVAVSASLAAVSFGLLIAQVARTIEQATVFSGVVNIVLAAIGGVMVPRFLMPQFMQDVAWMSPMTWGLEGFFDVLLRGGGVAEVIPESAGLLGFSCLMLGLAALAARRRLP